MFFIILRKALAFGNLVLQLWPKTLSTIEIAGFFDGQFLCKELVDILGFCVELVIC